MLVMARRAGESILIGEDIEIVVTHLGRSRVKLGIRAPKAVRVVAREVKLVGDQNVAAAAPAGEQWKAVLCNLARGGSIFPSSVRYSK